MFPIEAFRTTLEKAIAIFTKHQVRFHLTGGVTSVAYGEPRMTQDIDIVVDNCAVTARFTPFIESLRQSSFLFEEDAARVREGE